MRWEENELVIILSIRKTKPRVEHQCIICQIDLPIGETCYSFGAADRKHQRVERWYSCIEHSTIFNFDSVEDCPEWVQRFLFDNRLTREVWYIE